MVSVLGMPGEDLLALAITEAIPSPPPVIFKLFHIGLLSTQLPVEQHIKESA
jgi:hypothetical protein